MKIDFAKYADGLVPVIVQDFNTQKVLMLGFMNQEALTQNRGNGKGYILQPQQKTVMDERGGEW